MFSPLHALFRGQEGISEALGTYWRSQIYHQPSSPQYTHHLGELRVLWLGGEKVSGDIASLSELQNLTILDLDWTGVSGDIASLKELRNLTVLSLRQTQVSFKASMFSFKSREGQVKAQLKLPNCDIYL